jgi:hypothetical protein
LTKKVWQEKTNLDMTNTLKLAFQQMESQAKQLPASQNKGKANRIQQTKQLPASKNNGRVNRRQQGQTAETDRILRIKHWQPDKGKANRIQRAKQILLTAY